MLFEDFIEHYEVSIPRFAEAINVSRSLIYQILTGAREPSADLAIRIKLQTRNMVTPKDLLDREETIKREKKLTTKELYTPVKRWPKLTRKRAK